MATDFSRTLSLLRQEKGISQRKAAAALGISQALLSHYENGIREPGLAFVTRVCDFYHVSADFLLGRSTSRDGSMIDSEELYDGSAEKGSLRGSIMATLQKKLAVNTTGLLFDLLGRTNSREAITAAGDCIGATLYDLLRRLYPDDFRFLPPVRADGKPFISLLAGHREFEKPDWDADALLARAECESAEFALRCEKHRLY